MLQAIRRYVRTFFGCKECGEHFEGLAAESMDAVRTADQAILWLWKQHNRVNSRLAGRWSPVGPAGRRERERVLGGPEPCRPPVSSSQLRLHGDLARELRRRLSRLQTVLARQGPGGRVEVDVHLLLLGSPLVPWATVAAEIPSSEGPAGH